MRLAASRGPLPGRAASRRAANPGTHWSFGQRQSIRVHHHLPTQDLPTLPIILKQRHGIRHGIRHGLLHTSCNLNEASNDLNLTACSQGGTVSDADNVVTVHENAKNAINENAIGILIASACVMVELTGGHIWTRAAGAIYGMAATSGNMSNMTGAGHMKAAAERIVIAFRGILMAEIL